MANLVFTQISDPYICQCGLPLTLGNEFLDLNDPDKLIPQTGKTLCIEYTRKEYKTSFEFSYLS